MGKEQTILLPKVTQRKWWCGGKLHEAFSRLVFWGKDFLITTILYRVQLILPKNHCASFFFFLTQTAPSLSSIPRAAWWAQIPTHVRVSGWERRERAWLRIWLCSLFLAMLLIRSGTLGDSFNLSLSQIQTSTSSYYNIWLHYGIVERLN